MSDYTAADIALYFVAVLAVTVIALTGVAP